MNERVFKRGEVYWFPCDEDAVGHEMQKTRPGVVVSCNGANDRFGTVTIVLMSTVVDDSNPFKVRVKCGGKDSVVCCHEIKSVDKRRLLSFLGQLTKEEMHKVNHYVAAFLGMTHMAVGSKNDDTSEIQKLKVELDIAKGMYQEALRQLIELRVSADTRENVVVEDIVVDDEIEVVDDEIDEPVVQFLVEPERTADINTATEMELRGVGCTPEMSRRIIENRPYKSVEDLKKFGWMTRMGYQLVKGRLTCTPVVVEEPVVTPSEVAPPVEVKPQGKININTATAKEIREFLGCPKCNSWYITGYRTNNGKYVSLEELNDVPHLPRNFLAKYGEFLTIGEEDPEQEDPEQRLNINTATTRELMAVGFGKDVAARIVNIRKRFGNFKDVEDLLIIDGVSGKILRKLKDVLYVESSGVKPYYMGV